MTDSMDDNRNQPRCAQLEGGAGGGDAENYRRSRVCVCLFSFLISYITMCWPLVTCSSVSVRLLRAMGL